MATHAASPSHPGPRVEHARDPIGRQLGVADPIAGDDDRRTAEERSQVHAVREVEPLGVAEPAATPHAAEVGERTGGHERSAR